VAASNGNGQTHPREAWTDLYHTGPETLAGRFIRRFWQPIYRAEDLPAGRAKPIRFANEDFTLYRGEAPPPAHSPTRREETDNSPLAATGNEGAAHIVAFRCAHRGTQLSTGWVEGDELRCFYHGWKYGPDGQCTEQPAEPEPFCNRIRIRAIPTQEYLGLIFGYFGEGEPPPLPRFPEFENEADGIREAYTYGIPWKMNVFNSLENDPFHGAWVHRESYLASGRVGIPTVRCEETEYGYTTSIQLPETATHWREAQNHFLMPNANYATRTAPELGRDAWREALAWRVPVDDTHMISFGVNFTHMPQEKRADYLARRTARAEVLSTLPPYSEVGEAVLRGELRIEDIADRHQHPDRLFNIQDYVSQVGQGAIPDSSQWHFGREDVTVIMLRTLWQREMRNLAEGRPLKQWQRTGRLSVGQAHA
jgi:5,5'-dehydrodivanillate O-demethylase